MQLHLSMPDGVALDSEWIAAPHADLGVQLVESSEGNSDEDDDSSAASTIVGFLPLILIVVAVYFLLLRPRQRQMRQQRELQSNLDVGDEVMLTSGVYGFITGFETGTDVVWVEIDDDVQIRVSRAAVSGKVDTGAVAPSATGPGRADTADAPNTPSRRPTLKGGAKPAESKDTTEPAESE
jgi:preprotein translocase subunit YajC